MTIEKTKVQSKSVTFKAHQIETTANPNALNIDSNNDGTPDYLQRDKLPSLLKDIKDTTLAHIDTQKELENIKMIWRGYEYSTDHSAYIPVSPPMINELGIKQLSMILDPLANKHTINSNISEEWAHTQTKRLSLTLIKWIRNRRKNWGINPCDRTPIVEMMDAFWYSMFSRAINDKERDHTDKRLSLGGSNNPLPMQQGM